ncbi:MAG TPA: twin-arginine translocase TatA/TatE family subunit [Polyangiaceae bacterium]
MGSMSAAHWLVVLVIVLLVFGPKRLASLGKGMGEGIRSFREGLAGDGDAPHDDKAIQKEKPPGEKTPSTPS